MKLHRQQAQRLITVVVVVRDLGDELAVHAQREFAALRDEVILVPFIEPEIVRPGLQLQFLRVFCAIAIEHGALALQREIVAAEFIVEPRLPRLKVVVVHLVTRHVAVRQTAAAELEPAVHRR